MLGKSIPGVRENTAILQYADDTIIFFGHSEGLEVRLCRCLLICSLILGLKINLSKSYLYGVGMDEEVVQVISTSLGCQIVSLPKWYLGL